MKRIKLLNSDETAMVDDEDFDWLNEYEWYLHPTGSAVTDINDEWVPMEYMIVRDAHLHGRVNKDGTLQGHRKKSQRKKNKRK